MTNIWSAFRGRVWQVLRAPQQCPLTKPTLDSNKLEETAKRISRQIAEQFPGAGLSKLAAEIAKTTEKAGKRAEIIGGPIIWMRVVLALIVVIAVGGLVTYFQDDLAKKPVWKTALEFLDATKGSTAFLIAAAVFLFTQEIRWKRRRALRAVHELRALAHLIDMYQLGKDPTQLGHPTRSADVAGKPMDAERMRLYLHSCTELLAVVGKLGQLYIQNFPDAAAVAAVDQYEALANGLSNKIWQKLMILEQEPAIATASADVRPAEVVTVSKDGVSAK